MQRQGWGVAHLEMWAEILIAIVEPLSPERHPAQAVTLNQQIRSLDPIPLPSLFSWPAPIRHSASLPLLRPPAGRLCGLSRRALVPKSVCSAFTRSGRSPNEHKRFPPLRSRSGVAWSEKSKRALAMRLLFSGTPSNVSENSVQPLHCRTALGDAHAALLKALAGKEAVPELPLG